MYVFPILLNEPNNLLQFNFWPLYIYTDKSFRKQDVNYSSILFFCYILPTSVFYSNSTINNLYTQTAIAVMLPKNLVHTPVDAVFRSTKSTAIPSPGYHMQPKFPVSVLCNSMPTLPFLLYPEVSQQLYCRIIDTGIKQSLCHKLLGTEVGEQGAVGGQRGGGV